MIPYFSKCCEVRDKRLLEYWLKFRLKARKKFFGTLLCWVIKTRGHWLMRHESFKKCSVGELLCLIFARDVFKLKPKSVGRLFLNEFFHKQYTNSFSLSVLSHNILTSLYKIYNEIKLQECVWCFYEQHGSFMPLRWKTKRNKEKTSQKEINIFLY